VGKLFTLTGFREEVTFSLSVSLSLVNMKLGRKGEFEE
jgi:hypothetical protein